MHEPDGEGALPHRRGHPLHRPDRARTCLVDTAALHRRACDEEGLATCLAAVGAAQPVVA